ncbi:TerB family tellurite resistance protein [Ectothiorhodospiraceae bacterium BW-2]|nr:TerB family tellurite resistance protein [Ectothiorhodospiraceae bacterium BW-2]
MGLFDMFKGDSEEMTPHFAFATALIYMMGADGEFDNEEIGHLLSVLGGSKEGGSIGVGANNKALLDRAVRYAQKNPLDKFLEESTPILTEGQRFCILVNLIDSSLADGQAEREEQVMFEKIMQTWGISEAQFEPFFEVIVLKNDRSIFTDQSHPKNQPGYQVKLGV